jgi:hypothetical protein
MDAIQRWSSIIFSLCGPLLYCAAVAGNDLPQVVINGLRILPDEVLVGRIEQALRADDHLYTEHVTVRMRNGVVYLEGTIGDFGDLFRLLDDARAVAGARRVVQQLEYTGDMSDGPGW